MKEKKFNKLIDFITFDNFLDIHLNKLNFLEGIKVQELKKKINNSNDDLDPIERTFEYPLIFLDLIDYLCGARIHYP